MMPAMMQPELDYLLRFLIIALVVIAGVVGVSFCADGLCSECNAVCCRGADRSGLLARLTQTLADARKSAVSFTLPLLPPAASGWARASSAPVPARVLIEVSALRI